MIAISVKNLAEAVRAAAPFSLPEMGDGVAYLYNTVFRPMSKSDDIRLSELDFDAFEAEDIDSFCDIYADVLERNHYAANGIASTLRSLDPASRAVAYV